MPNEQVCMNHFRRMIHFTLLYRREGISKFSNLEKKSLLFFGRGVIVRAIRFCEHALF
jgi:hypothetical protein